MRTILYKEYATAPAIGYFVLSNRGGLEILDILPGIDDYAVACFNFGTGRQKIRKHKICHTPSNRAYIRKDGVRYYFDEIMGILN